MMRKALALAALVIAFGSAASAETKSLPLKEVQWSFGGRARPFDQDHFTHGSKVYHDVFSACHSMNLMSYRNLGQPGGPFFDPKYPNPNDNPYVKTIVQDFKVSDIDSDAGDVIKRPATPADAFVS